LQRGRAVPPVGERDGLLWLSMISAARRPGITCST
jgi:hypothetical protein